MSNHPLLFYPLDHVHSSHSQRLPICQATGCRNPVYCDPLLGQFIYCSPKCRDEHLLPSYNKKLKEDIDKFEHDCMHGNVSVSVLITKSQLGLVYWKGYQDKVVSVTIKKYYEL